MDNHKDVENFSLWMNPIIVSTGNQSQVRGESRTNHVDKCCCQVLLLENYFYLENIYNRLNLLVYTQRSMISAFQS